MTMEEIVGSFITHEHTLQMDKEEMENNKKKMKDLALKILMRGQKDDLDEETTFITRNFKRFLRKKVRLPTSRRHEDEDRAREAKKYRKIKEKKESSKE